MSKIRNCTVCGGAIHRRWTLGDPEEQPWHHLNYEDWTDNPHNAVPAEGDFDPNYVVEVAK